MVASLVGAPLFPQVKGGVLFLEDVAEHPYRVERMLAQLLHAGVLARQKAIVLGQFTEYADAARPRGYSMKKVVDWLRGQLPRTPVLGLLVTYDQGVAGGREGRFVGGRARRAGAGPHRYTGGAAAWRVIRCATWSGATSHSGQRALEQHRQADHARARHLLTRQAGQCAHQVGARIPEGEGVAARRRRATWVLLSAGVAQHVKHRRADVVHAVRQTRFGPARAETSARKKRAQSFMLQPSHLFVTMPGL